MLKIRDLELNTIYDLTLMVKSATARETKAGKPYLAIEFYDGTDTIASNFWDWGGKNIPPNNAILDVTAQVTEWQSTKQLNVKRMATNITASAADFMPASGHNIEAIYLEALDLARSVESKFLRELALKALTDLYNLWTTVPGANTVHHAYVGGTLIHSCSVAKIAKAIAENIVGANVDLCVVGGLLHDIGKLFTYQIDGISISMTDEGKLYNHVFMGAEFIGNFAEHNFIAPDYDEQQLTILRHIILSHHGKLEYGSPVSPCCIEAYIVSHADGVDAAAEQIRELSGKVGEDVMWTDRIYTLDNKPHLTTQYVAGVMRSADTDEEE